VASTATTATGITARNWQSGVRGLAEVMIARMSGETGEGEAGYDLEIGPVGDD